MVRSGEISDDVAISVRGVSKKYRLFASHTERLKEALHLFRKRYHREFWALRDVSFDVRKGETVGILGRNGAGKSTLLEIVTGVLQSTEGTVVTRGRVAALLELGAGFNPEFTGRENVMVHGAITGVAHDELLRRMPDIEAFADIGEFFDQPVKIYSSGMFVRVAFAAAINVDPDILIVDEALAVGDARFQQKCFERFRVLQQQGKTILLVSHGTDLIAKHCNRALILETGAIVASGAPEAVLPKYHEILFTGGLGQRPPAETRCESRSGSLEVSGRSASMSEAGPSAAQTDPDAVATFLSQAHLDDHCGQRRNYNHNEYRFGDRRARIVDYLICSGELIDPASVTCGAVIEIYMKVFFDASVERPMVGFSIKSIDGQTLFGRNTRHADVYIRPAVPGEIAVYRYRIKLDLAHGDIFIELGVAEKLPDEDNPADIRKNLVHLVMIPESVFEGVAMLDMQYDEVVRFVASTSSLTDALEDSHQLAPGTV